MSALPSKIIQRYGIKRGKQRYRCTACHYQFCISYQGNKRIKNAYQAYVLGKQTLRQLSQHYHLSIPTLRKYFDNLIVTNHPTQLAQRAINLIFDATFFSRTDGILVFRANKKNIYWRFIRSETLQDIEESLVLLINQGYRFLSFTIDGRKGVIQRLETRFPHVPIQLCHFHQAQIVRRYTTNNPKTDCGKALKQLMTLLATSEEYDFSQRLEAIRAEYHEFLKEKNETEQFIHRRLRSAFRSLKSNLPYLFTYKKYPALAIPNTTNSCDGSFAHWKQKIKIHSGMFHHRRNKMIDFLLSQ
jgi:hypothetical protein